jgi:hypothetical protein
VDFRAGRAEISEKQQEAGAVAISRFATGKGHEKNPIYNMLCLLVDFHFLSK